MLNTRGIFIVITSFIMLLIGLHQNNIKKLSIVSNNFELIRTNLKYFIFSFLFWLFAVCVTDSFDISNYKWAYDHYMSHGKEPIFDIVRFSFKSSGWDFISFKFLWTSIVLFLVYTGIKKYSKKPEAVFSLAVITVMTGFITQMRSAIVGAIFLNTFPLILSGKLRDRFLYLIIIVLSAQIHTLGYVFIIFLLINPKNGIAVKKVHYILICIATLMSLFLSSFSISLLYDTMIMLPFNDDNFLRGMSYFQGEGRHFRYELFLICKHLFLFILTQKACEIQKYTEYVNGAFPYDRQKTRMIQAANLLILVFLPITILSPSFERLFNYFVLIQYAVVFNVGKSKIILFNKFLLKQTIQSVMVVGVLFITAVELYFSSSDMIRILNSVEWIF